jgi:hypothetical protein
MRFVLLNESLNALVKIQNSIGGHGKPKPRGPRMLQKNALRHEIVADVGNQVDFQKRFPTDEINGDAGTFPRFHVDLCAFVGRENHVNELFCRFKGHPRGRFRVFVAVGAAKIAGFRHLHGDIACEISAYAHLTVFMLFRE